MRKICVVTSSRAEYGLLKNLIQQIKETQELELQLIVTGSHFSKEFGETYKEIEQDFVITKMIPMNTSSDKALDVSTAMATLQMEISKTLHQLQPDILVLLGDRYEILSVAISCMMLNIPIAHIHGGETTEGAIDEAVRHSITKMSHLHFCATQLYKKRIIQLGEEPSRVFNVGSLGVENISKTTFLTKDELEESIGLKFSKKNLLVTYHPVTLEKNSSQEQFENLLSALDMLEDTNIIFTKANADVDGKIINTLIDDYVRKNPKNTMAHTSLGQLRYFSVLRYVDGIVGNSSSGIIEAPNFHIATINIGNRQNGREKALSIVDVKTNKDDILNAINNIYTDEFQAQLKRSSNPYQARDTSFKIKNVLKSISLKNILQKSFFNLDMKTNIVLVISVHPDDETLGCGGTLLKHKDNADETHWLICTQTNDKKIKIIRDEEIEQVNDMYQFNSKTNLMLDTTRVDEYSMSELIMKISKVITTLKPNIIYLPFREDIHSDHRVIFDAAFSCTKSFRYPFIEKIYMMETLSETEFTPAFQDGVFVPNVFVNIEKYIEKKIEIMKIYKDEIAQAPFPRSEENIKALSVFRGASSGYKHAESFMLLKSIQK